MVSDFVWYSLPMTPAGWYPDPANPQMIRYWNSHEWTAETKQTSPPISQLAPHAMQVSTTPSPSKKTTRTIWKVCGVVAAILIVGNIVSSIGNDSPRRVAAQSPATYEERPSLTSPVPSQPSQPSASPRETITFTDGLAATVTAVTEGTSSNQFDPDGPFTVISVELRNTGTETLDAADWYTPYLNYGPGGLAADDALIAGTVNGVETNDLKGSGLIPPGGVVTVNSAYDVSIAQLSPATITPQWPGRRLWTGDFAAAFGG
ncbi:hypothetical protein CH262_18915 [Rhodococcus sp. 05-2255-1e]|nr:hypothetical protein CH262_18915 [Rhodococcus sp. 05-2255-1e]